jgi:hypothetical protein
MGAGALVVALLLAGPDVGFEWEAPSEGAAPSYYEVELVQEGEDPLILTSDAPSIILDPALGKSFEVRVRACLSQTCGEWSELSQPISLNRTADFNGDGGVGAPDYLGFGAMMRSQNLDADLNGDTGVGLPDYIEFAEHFGTCIGSVDVRGEELPAYVPCQRSRN